MVHTVKFIASRETTEIVFTAEITIPDSIAVVLIARPEFISNSGNEIFDLYFNLMID
jgi:UDP-N-acetyl-D-mannosaminuronic acid transferase (WecB/TagA/CpsF family)